MSWLNGEASASSQVTIVDDRSGLYLAYFLHDSFADTATTVFGRLTDEDPDPR